MYTLSGNSSSIAKIILLQELAKYSPVPVLNALSSLWHPTQVLADLLTLHEHAHLFATDPTSPDASHEFSSLPSLNVAYVGDSANVLHDMLVTYPRMGHKLRVASPPKQRYQCPPEVWARVQQLGCDKNISWGSDPREAVQGADVVVTDTWYCAQAVRPGRQTYAIHVGYQWARKLRKLSV